MMRSFYWWRPEAALSTTLGAFGLEPDSPGFSTLPGSSLEGERADSDSWYRLIVPCLLLITFFFVSGCGDNIRPAKSSALVVSPEVVSFSNVQLDSSDVQTLTVRNRGEEMLNIMQVSINGGAELQLEGLPELPLLLEPDGELNLQVRYAPKDIGRDEGEIILVSSSADNPTEIVQIKTNGVFPVIQVSPPSIDFDQVDAGELAQRTVTVFSVGQAPLEIKNLVLSGSADFSYAVKTSGGAAPTVLPPDSSFDIEITYHPATRGFDSANLILSTNDAQRPELAVPIKANGDGNECPHTVLVATVNGVNMPSVSSDGTEATLSAEVLATISLDAGQSTSSSGGPLRYQWSVIERPQDSTAHIAPWGSQAVEDSPQTRFFLDLVGTYVVQLQVVDDQGTPSCNTARVKIVAITDEAIHVQLVWHTPGAPGEAQGCNTCGPDVDLHLSHGRAAGRWNLMAGGYDCYYENPTPSWGSASPDDDPRLDIDDVDGRGPENINIDAPEANTTYQVGVYYFADYGMGTSYATVRIYLSSRLVDEIENRALTFGGNGFDDGDFWHVGTITWGNNGEGQFSRVDRMYRGFP